MKKIILGIFIFLTMTGFAHAQEAYTQNGTPISPTQGVVQQTQGNTGIPYTPLEPLPGLAQYETGNANFGQLLSMVFKLLIILAALIAVGSFVYAGISYMVSDVPLVKFDASKRLQASFLGLAILLGSWIILFTINPQLVSFSGALNPVAVFQSPQTTRQPINNPNCTNGVGTGCLTPDEQAVIDTVATNRAAAGSDSFQEAKKIEQEQSKACTDQGGDILPPSWLSTHPGGPRGSGYTSVPPIAGLAGFRCGLK